MKQFIFFLLTLALSFEGFSQNTLKVMTYNIHHANPPARKDIIDIEGIATVINTQDPDLVALQELDVNTRRSGGVDQVRKLAELTGVKAFFSKGIDHEGGAYGIAILSKYEISSTERFALPFKDGLKYEQRSLAVVNVNIPHIGPVYFACTHLDLKDEHRMLQVMEINRILGARKQPVILAGDFNFQASNPAMKIIEDKFIRSCTADCPPTIPDTDPVSEIDFVFLKKGSRLNFQNHQVITGIHASDHLPVVVTISNQK